MIIFTQNLQTIRYQETYLPPTQWVSVYHINKIGDRTSLVFVNFCMLVCLSGPYSFHPIVRDMRNENMLMKNTVPSHFYFYFFIFDISIPQKVTFVIVLRYKVSLYVHIYVIKYLKKYLHIKIDRNIENYRCQQCQKCKPKPHTIKLNHKGTEINKKRVK